MGSQDPPKAPNLAKNYQQGIDVMLANLPQLLSAEQQYRQQIDPQRIQEQQQLQQQFGPTQYAQQLQALREIDPTGQNLRTDLGHQIQSSLDAGYNITDEQRNQIRGTVRGAEASRGNILGNAPALLETTAITQAGERQRQQNIDNAGQFLQSPTPEQQLLTIGAVQPDRSSGYVNPAAGTQGANFGLANYQNLLAQYQLGGGGGNAWSRAADGASKGSVGGPYGALFGAIDGAANGPLYQTTVSSDRRLKTNIVFICHSNLGFPVYQFEYSDMPGRRFEGTIAQELQKLLPGAVYESKQGWLSVEYGKTDIVYRELSGGSNRMGGAANKEKSWLPPESNLCLG